MVINLVAVLICKRMIVFLVGLGNWNELFGCFIKTCELNDLKEIEIFPKVNKSLQEMYNVNARGRITTVLSHG